jgi:hypothetical protein
VNCQVRFHFEMFVQLSLFAEILIHFFFAQDHEKICDEGRFNIEARETENEKENCKANDINQNNNNNKM